MARWSCIVAIMLGMCVLHQIVPGCMVSQTCVRESLTKCQTFTRHRNFVWEGDICMLLVATSCSCCCCPLLEKIKCKFAKKRNRRRFKSSCATPFFLLKFPLRLTQSAFPLSLSLPLLFSSSSYFLSFSFKNHFFQNGLHFNACICVAWWQWRNQATYI